MDEDLPHGEDPWATPDTSLLSRYEDGAERLITFAPGINHEVCVEIGGKDGIYVDALDLLRVVSHVVLGMVYEPSPTEAPRSQARGES